MKRLLLIAFSAANIFAAEHELKPLKVADSLWCVFGDLKPPSKENKGFVSNICWADEFSYLTNFEMLHPRNLYNLYGQFELGTVK